MHKYDASYYHHIDRFFGPDPEGDQKIFVKENPADPSTWQLTSADSLFLKLIQEAHEKNIRVILDIIFNHSGHNWDYEGNVVDPPYKPWPDYYNKGPWLDADGLSSSTSDPIPDTEVETGVWPEELQRNSCYSRAGKGSLSGEDIDDPHAEMRRTDFDGSFRDFNLDDFASKIVYVYLDVDDLDLAVGTYDMEIKATWNAVVSIDKSRTIKLRINESIHS